MIERVRLLVGCLDRKCKPCFGSGLSERWHQNQNAIDTMIVTICKVCGGTGRVF